jgi:hypothetical protein
MSGNIPLHMSAESSSNISPNPSEVISTQQLSDIKDTVHVTLATDDNKQLNAHKKSITNHYAFNIKIKISLITIKLGYPEQ